ncbi:uncharacterized protein B0H18DRAFT_951790 [Fomitopsis serialis]|uniref:uncharacterized protein n=1 Tax=Fomitopsis serialis TaxID=139415 RepID=UPI002008E6F9|nr:uncharacterized protein B0H18DRAFT_951790 [Neoantrodia serialis]KAH9933813.1 hypothetical protein B0H18DRAFT_951790 [Neoantrodia serialis]
MPWVFGFPLDAGYAIRIGKECNLVKYPNPRDFDYFVAATRHIASAARWEHVRSCWVKGESQLVYGVYVDERFRKHPPKRLAEYMPIEAKPEWYRAEDCTYTPWEGERWSGTYEGEDDDLVDDVPTDEDEYVDEDEDGYGDENEWDYEAEEHGKGEDEQDDPRAGERVVLPKRQHGVDEYVSPGHSERYDEAEGGRDANIASIPVRPVSEQGGVAANTLAPQFGVFTLLPIDYRN